MSKKNKNIETVETETEIETTETVDTETVENIETVEATTLVEEGDFTVVSNLKHNGQRYEVGDTINLSSEEATRLVADGVVK